MLSDNGLDGLPGDQWSEFAFMVNYLKANLNDTDIVSGGDYSSSFWDSLYEGMYFSAATWRTIDGGKFQDETCFGLFSADPTIGLNRLPLSFHPLVDSFTTLNRKIERVQWKPGCQKVNLQWRDNYTDVAFQNSSYDYAVIAVPFSIVKKWRFSGMQATLWIGDDNSQLMIQNRPPYHD